MRHLTCLKQEMQSNQSEYIKSRSEEDDYLPVH